MVSREQIGGGSHGTIQTALPAPVGAGRAVCLIYRSSLKYASPKLAGG